MLGRALRALGHEADRGRAARRCPLHVDGPARRRPAGVRRARSTPEGLDVEALARDRRRRGARDARAPDAARRRAGAGGARRAARLGRRGRAAARRSRTTTTPSSATTAGPLGALQGRAPEQVAYLGSASKTLAPGLRLGWLLLPGGARRAGAASRSSSTTAAAACSTSSTLARLLDGDAYDRHLRLARRRNRRAARRAASAALAEHLPGARLEGMAAGLHAIARLPERPARPPSSPAAATPAASASAGCRRPDGTTDALVLGYAALSEPAIAEGRPAAGRGAGRDRLNAVAHGRSRDFPILLRSPCRR